ncbi:MAG: RNA polymerase subunit sigma, partial [Betaproteobacteria bacterium]
MTSGRQNHPRPLTLVSGTSAVRQSDAPAPGEDTGKSRARGVDWSILMAHAQAGDQAAYGRLLEEIAPYVRSLAARCHRDLSDIEDSVQDVLLT